VLLNTRYEDAVHLAETVRPAGIIPSERFARWLLRQEQRIFRQIYGLKALAASLEPELEIDPLGETTHYSTFSSHEVMTLPSVLARYLYVYRERLRT
jgi:hypothetical protein